MDYEPTRCVVVEDSILGVTGAVAAGMTVLGFAGASHIQPGHEDALRDIGAVATFDDLSLLPEDFVKLELPLRRLFITENRTNGLAFPDHPGSMVVFGLGYGLDRLIETPSLHELDIVYWGDIDTHGFRILDRLRATLPQARSLLMDRATLDAHQPLWGQEPADKRHTGTLSRLTASETALFDELRHDRIAERVRLEQERIAFGWLENALSNL